MALLCKSLDRLYAQGKFSKAKSSEIFNFPGVGFKSLTLSDAYPTLLFLCVYFERVTTVLLHASNLKVYRRVEC